MAIRSVARKKSAKQEPQFDPMSPLTAEVVADVESFLASTSGAAILGVEEQALVVLLVWEMEGRAKLLYENTSNGKHSENIFAGFRRIALQLFAVTSGEDRTDAVMERARELLDEMPFNLRKQAILFHTKSKFFYSEQEYRAKRVAA